MTMPTRMTGQLDLEQIDHDLEYASAGIDGPDMPYNPHALRALRAAEALRAAVGRVLDLTVDPFREVPPDGSFVIAHYSGGHQDIDVDRLWFRSDGDEPHADGDWYLAVKNAGPHQWGEVLWMDDPACDRGSVTLEVLVPAEVIAQAVAGYEPAEPERIETPDESAAIVEANLGRRPAALPEGPQ